MTPSEHAHLQSRPAPLLVLWTLRGGSLLVVLLVLLQGALAGAFGTGDLNMLRLHSHNANITFYAQSIVIIGAVGLWWRGRGPQWPMWAALILLVAIGAQIALGHRRVVEVHLPLSLLIFAAAVAFSAVMFVHRWRTSVALPTAEIVPRTGEGAR